MKNEKVITNFKKAKTLLETIVEMKEKDQYCIDIMQQNLAVIGMLRSAHEQMMEDHLRHCFNDAVISTDEMRKEQMIEEIIRVTKLYSK